LKKSNPQNRNLQKTSKFQLKQATRKSRNSKKPETPQKNTKKRFFKKTRNSTKQTSPNSLENRKVGNTAEKSSARNS